jgi:hypothetical protein
MNETLVAYYYVIFFWIAMVQEIEVIFVLFHLQPVNFYTEV